MKSLFLTAAEETAGVSEWLNALTRLNLQTILSAAVIFLVGYALIKWVCKLADKLLARNENLDPSIRGIAVNAGRILLLFLLLLFLLRPFLLLLFPLRPFLLQLL